VTRDGLDRIAAIASSVCDKTTAAWAEGLVEHVPHSDHDFCDQDDASKHERWFRRNVLLILKRLHTFLMMHIELLKTPEPKRALCVSELRLAEERAENSIRFIEGMVDQDARKLALSFQRELGHYYERDLFLFRSEAKELARTPSAKQRFKQFDAASLKQSNAWHRETTEAGRRQVQIYGDDYAHRLANVELAAISAACEALRVDSNHLSPRHIELPAATLDFGAPPAPATTLEIILDLAINLCPPQSRKLFLERLYRYMLWKQLDGLRRKLRDRIAYSLESWRCSIRTAISLEAGNIRDPLLAVFKGLLSSDEAQLQHVSGLINDVETIRAAVISQTVVN
jgi:hypothetical protein